MSLSSPPRYDRIVSLVFVVLIGLTIIFLIDANPNTLRIRLGGDLPTLAISWLLIGSLLLITSAGADLLARSHPQMQTRSLPTLNLGVTTVEIAPAFWILPAFSVIGSFAFFRILSTSLQGLAFALALLVAGGGLLATLICQHYALDRNPQLSQRAQLALQVIAYLAAFACFSAIYYARQRTLYSATLIGATGSLLAYAMLQWTGRVHSFRLSLLVGLLLAEATWALNYWAASFLVGGTLLLVIFYITSGLLQHQASGKLQRRLIVEYALLGSCLLAIVIYATFRF
ncbi:hypothetical protein HC891_08480 [Candidatus Gracilibacteria bacterium]|nr:hypothetical protein [Candidatus Gracilibacteria bacterium]